MRRLTEEELKQFKQIAVEHELNSSTEFEELQKTFLHFNEFKEKIYESMMKSKQELTSIKNHPSYLDIGIIDIANLTEGCFILFDFITSATILSFLSEANENTKRAWTDQEDLELLEAVTTKNMKPQEAAMMLGRSPFATMARLSNLFGVKRDSKPVDGIFKGIMQTNEDGSADICGRVFDR